MRSDVDVDIDVDDDDDDGGGGGGGEDHDGTTWDDGRPPTTTRVGRGALLEVDGSTKADAIDHVDDDDDEQRRNDRGSATLLFMIGKY
jgi:hypothetical protein